MVSIDTASSEVPWMKACPKRGGCVTVTVPQQDRMICVPSYALILRFGLGFRIRPVHLKTRPIRCCDVSRTSKELSARGGIKCQPQRKPWGNRCRVECSMSGGELVPVTPYIIGKELGITILSGSQVHILILAGTCSSGQRTSTSRIAAFALRTRPRTFREVFRQCPHTSERCSCRTTPPHRLGSDRSWWSIVTGGKVQACGGTILIVSLHPMAIDPKLMPGAARTVVTVAPQLGHGR
jgi:hypothetical protein